MIKVICVNCSHQFEIQDPQYTSDYEKCPKCGDGRIWKDNDETRRILKVEDNTVGDG